MYCKNCGKVISNEANSCPKCGQPIVQVLEKKKWVAFWLCFGLGGIGAHRYYMGKTTSAVLMTLFFWTYIPLIISIVDLIVIGVNSQEKFDVWVNKQ